MIIREMTGWSKNASHRVGSVFEINVSSNTTLS